jgi:cytoskeleton protein RodZ
MSDIGAILREAREEQGLTITEVEARTRIRARFLTALENNDFEALDGAVYTRGFLRNYAIFLGLDPEPLLAELGAAQQVIPSSRASRSREPHYLSAPLQTNPLPLGRILFTLSVLLIIGVGAYWLWWAPGRLDSLLSSFDAGPQVAATPAEQESGDTGDITGTDDGATEPLVAGLEPEETPVAQQIALATPVPTATLPPRTPTPDPEPVVGEAPEPEPEPEAAPAVEPDPESAPEPDGIVVGAQVFERTWVRVLIDAQPQPIIERVLEAGESFTWEGAQAVNVRIGNAGGISFVVNGQDLGVLGGPGDVIERQWQRDPDGGGFVQVEPQS